MAVERYEKVVQACDELIEEILFPPKSTRLVKGKVVRRERAKFITDEEEKDADTVES